MAIESFVPPFREAKFCSGPSCVIGNLGCAAGEKVTEQRSVLCNSRAQRSQTSENVGRSSHSEDSPFFYSVQYVCSLRSRSGPSTPL